MPEPERKCPGCQSTDLEEERLGTKASAWPVTFGSTLFAKRELFAYGCRECGLVSLYVGEAADWLSPS